MIDDPIEAGSQIQAGWSEPFIKIEACGFYYVIYDKRDCKSSVHVQALRSTCPKLSTAME